MPVPMLDLSAQNQPLRDEIGRALDELMETSQFILGPAVERFEADLAAYCGTGQVIGVSSGTDALIVALMAAGIGPGDEVIVPAFTFFATAGAVHRVGARCVFADIDPATFNLDAASAEAAVTQRTRAIVPVHLYGQCAAMGPILALAQRHGLFVLEDAAQAIGARDAQGRAAGSIGRAGALSFYPTKNLGGFGDAGAVLTDDRELGRTIAQLRQHGQSDAYRHERVGGNFRIDAVQAAVLRVKLRRLETWAEARRLAAKRYEQLLRGLPITLPPAPADGGGRHVFNQYTIRCERRDALCEHLHASGIGHKVYYPLPLHLQPCFADLGYRRGALPESERASAEVLSLPIYPELRPEQQEQVGAAVCAFYQ